MYPFADTARRRWAPLACAALLVACMGMAPSHAQDAPPRIESSLNLPEGTPQAPQGYATGKEAAAAVMNGSVEVVDPNTSRPEGVAEHLDIEYKNVDGHSLQLDVFHPESLDEPRPLLVLIHGGSWVGGNKDDIRLYAYKFAQRGYVTASIAYRLRRIAPYPAAVQDVKCAVRWLKAHADQFHIDPDRVAAMGWSAGGHLAMMLGYATNVPALEEGCPVESEVTSHVQAVINFYGPVDLTTDFARDKTAVTGFLNTTYDEKPGVFKEASPIFHLTAEAPPTLTFHGTADDVVPIDQADMLAAKLDALEVPQIYDRIDGWPHVFDLQKDLHERALYVIDAFLAAHLPIAEPAEAP